MPSAKRASDKTFEALLHSQVMPGDEWPWTDDTAQALVLSHHLLKQQGTIDLPKLALEFAKEYQSNPLRVYGGTAHRVLRLTAAGEDWSRVSQDVFSGQGSMGNGAAMRVAPLGALLCRDLHQVIQEAAKSARPTHANPRSSCRYHCCRGCRSSIGRHYLGWTRVPRTSRRQDSNFRDALPSYTSCQHGRRQLRQACRLLARERLRHAHPTHRSILRLGREPKCRQLSERHVDHVERLR